MITFIVLYTQCAQAEQCIFNLPLYDTTMVHANPNHQLIIINSDELHANYPGSALFTGNVNIEQGNSILTATEVELNQVQNPWQKGSSRTITATGNVCYSDPQITLTGPKAWLDFNTKDIDVYEGSYQLVGRQGRGEANKIKIRSANRYTFIEKGTFTSCLPGDDSWSVTGSKLIHDRIEQVAEVWNARLQIGGIPVFYSPYIQLPIGDKRRSGFLIPHAKYGNNNGFEFMLPYYWNLAPNYDVTITPHYMARRGLQWQHEFRYLMRPGSGLMALDWLVNDKEYKKNNTDNGARWLFYWNHNGLMDQVWRFNVDFTKVSDLKYFTDLDSKYGSTTAGYATQKISFGYANENWYTILSAKKFQIFDKTKQAYFNSYKVQPQLDISYYKNNLGPFDLHLYGQIVRFNSINLYSPHSTRWHLESTLNLPLHNRWGSLNTEIKLLTSHYKQDVPGYLSINHIYQNSTNHYKLATPNLNNSINRILPQFKVDGNLVFSRPITYSVDSIQTLEPHIQYLYVAYRDQSKIHTYDTTLLQTDYSGLFRDRTYSGLDRIASQSRVSSGLTTRIYDNVQVERYNISLGQIYYLNHSDTGEDGINYDNNHHSGSLAWAGDTYWKIDDRWSLRGGLQYDTRLNSISLGNCVLEYRQDLKRMVQLNYRYATSEYIQTALHTNQIPAYQHGIAQLGITCSWPIVDRWTIVSAYYYNTHAKQYADQLLGLKYNTCCWSVTLGYERKITDWNYSKNISIYDNKVSFNIELRGVSRAHSISSTEMLHAGILPPQNVL